MVNVLKNLSHPVHINGISMLFCGKLSERKCKYLGSTKKLSSFADTSNGVCGCKCVCARVRSVDLELRTGCAGISIVRGEVCACKST